MGDGLAVSVYGTTQAASGVRHVSRAARQRLQTALGCTGGRRRWHFDDWTTEEMKLGRLKLMGRGRQRRSCWHLDDRTTTEAVGNSRAPTGDDGNFSTMGTDCVGGSCHGGGSVG